MSTISLNQKTVDTLIDEVENHKNYRPEINNEQKAKLALNGLATFTFLVRKAEAPLNYYISFVDEDHLIVSKRFIIDKEKLQYQYYQGFRLLKDGSIDPNDNYDKCDDPYYKDFFSSLDEVIYIASMKCDNMHKVQPLV